MPQQQTKTGTEHMAAENPDAPLLKSVEADLADVPFRSPIIDYHTPSTPDETPNEHVRRAQECNVANLAERERTDSQWLAVTEAVRRAVVASPDVRRVAASFIGQPLSEQLPALALEELAAQDTRTARLAKRAGRLGTVLGLDPVPDKLITPDIRTASALHRREDALRELTDWKRRDSPDTYQDMLDATRRRVKKGPGISKAERDLVAQRYRYARDVKMLGLMAELYDHPVPAEVTIKDGLITHALPSGTLMVMTGAAFEATPTLLDPATWENRRQLKDRVYTVRAGGSDYIMKERKTPRHTDTTDGGHRETLTSQQELLAAREFSNLGTIRRDEIALRWEKPLAYVEFPDGYQFCLFESEAELPSSSPLYQLAGAIADVPAAYRDEYEKVRQGAKQVYVQRTDLLDGFEPEPAKKPKWPALSRKARRQKAAYQDQLVSDDLTFEEFAELKAHYLLWEADELYNDIVHEKGYVNTDNNGQAFRVRPGEEGKRPILELVGFDFEYYTQNRKRADQIRQRIADHVESGETARMFSYRVAGKRKIMEAASYVMLERLTTPGPPTNKEPKH